MKWSRTTLAAAISGVTLLIGAGAALAQNATASVFDRIQNDRTLRIAYREDAPPFSFKDSAGNPAGYMVDLCRAVADQLAQQLNVVSLSLVYAPVTATDRFNVIEQHTADLLCEPTSATLSRRETVDFSISTFVDGAGLMIRADGPHDLKAMAGQKVGVLAGTTTEQELRSTLQQTGIAADVVPARTHTEGLAMLDDGRISAYFADRSILIFLIKGSKAPDKLALANDYLSIEPYALALPHGDETFRLAVDRALSHIYRSGGIGPIFERNFGDAQLGPILQTLYLVTGLPD